MPDRIFNRLPDATFASSDATLRQARGLGVSSFALLVRAYKAKRISIGQYQQLKADADRAFHEFVKREAERKARQEASDSSGGPNYYLLKVNRNSRLFTQTVLDAYRQGYIEPTTASSLLYVQVNRFPKLEEQLYR